MDDAIIPAIGKIDPNSIIRTLGRAVDAIPTPISYGVSLGASVGPEFIDNCKKGASSSEFEADFTIDLIGWAFSEVASLSVGIAALVLTGGFVPFAAGAKIGQIFFPVRYMKM